MNSKWNDNIQIGYVFYSFLFIDIILLLCSQVYTGPYRPPIPNVTEVTKYEDVAVDTLVAVNLENYKPPNVGRVVAVGDEDFTVKWMKGGYRKEWTIDTRWPETLIPKESVIFYGFNLENGKNVERFCQILEKKIQIIKELIYTVLV